jgi:hypothetical protein
MQSGKLTKGTIDSTGWFHVADQTLETGQVSGGTGVGFRSGPIAT